MWSLLLFAVNIVVVVVVGQMSQSFTLGRNQQEYFENVTIIITESDQDNLGVSTKKNVVRVWVNKPGVMPR